MTHPVAQSAAALIDELQKSLKISLRLAGSEIEEREIAAMYDLYDEDIADAESAYGEPVFRGSGALWTRPPASAHALIPVKAAQGRVKARFEELCHHIGQTAPVLGAPLLRMSVWMWPKNRNTTLQICLFGVTPNVLSGASLQEAPEKLADLVCALAPLQAPRALYEFDPSDPPVPGYDVIQAAVLHLVCANSTLLWPSKDQIYACAQRARMWPSPLMLDEGIKQMQTLQK